MTEIKAITFKEPEMFRGDLCIPIKVSSNGYGSDITVYLTHSKLETLKERAYEGQAQIEDALAEMSEGVDHDL